MYVDGYLGFWRLGTDSRSEEESGVMGGYGARMVRLYNMLRQKSVSWTWYEYAEMTWYEYGVVLSSCNGDVLIVAGAHL
jgi:hypothetical protein